MNVMNVIRNIMTKPLATRGNARVFRIFTNDFVSANIEARLMQDELNRNNNDVIISSIRYLQENIMNGLENDIQAFEGSIEKDKYFIYISPDSLIPNTPQMRIAIALLTSARPDNALIYITTNSKVDESYKCFIEVDDADPSSSYSSLTLINRLCNTLNNKSMNNDILNIAASIENITPPTKLATRIADVFSDDECNIVRNMEDLRTEMINTVPTMHIEEGVKIDEVIGLTNVKKWIKTRFKYTLEDEPPKGIILIGVPGCGKSLIAKGIGDIVDYPVIRYQPASSFSGVVGSTENNIRRDLRTIDSLGKCIVFIDEIEKQLSGIHSSGASDGGTTARSIGQIISWLQDRKSDAFLIATANSFVDLPEEILRSGRFDEIFFVGVPSEKNRLKMFKLYMKRYASQFSISDSALKRIAKQSELFSGADIKKIVIEYYYNMKEYLSNKGREKEDEDEIFGNDEFMKAMAKIDTQGKSKDEIREQCMSRLITNLLPFGKRFPEKYKRILSTSTQFVDSDRS